MTIPKDIDPCSRLSEAVTPYLQHKAECSSRVPQCGCGHLKALHTTWSGIPRSCSDCDCKGFWQPSCDCGLGDVLTLLRGVSTAPTCPDCGKQHWPFYGCFVPQKVFAESHIPATHPSDGDALEQEIGKRRAVYDSMLNFLPESHSPATGGATPASWQCLWCGNKHRNYSGPCVRCGTVYGETSPRQPAGEQP